MVMLVWVPATGKPAENFCLFQLRASDWLEISISLELSLFFSFGCIMITSSCPLYDGLDAIVLFSLFGHSPAGELVVKR